MRKKDLIEFLRKENQELKNKINIEKQEIEDRKIEYNEIKSKIEARKKELSYIDEISGEMEYNIYNPELDFFHFNYAERWKEFKKKIVEISKSDDAFFILEKLRMGGSEIKGVKLQKKLIKLAIKHLNNFSIQQHKKINQLTYELNIEKFSNEVEKINKIFEPLKVCVSNIYKDTIIKSFSFVLDSYIQKQIEREKAREEKEKIREEKKLQEEIERKKEKINIDVQKYELRIKELILLSKKDKENKENEIARLKEKIAILESEETELSSRLSKIGAGWVYIISNIGSFGENIYKIGVTRRLDPEERIRELSTASVPFIFDKHALIWSEKAFELESNLHRAFDKKRVNKVNKRKEFFKVTLEEIKNISHNISDVSIEWIDHPLAIEYRLSMKGI